MIPHAIGRSLGSLYRRLSTQHRDVVELRGVVDERVDRLEHALDDDGGGLAGVLPQQLDQPRVAKLFVGAAWLICMVSHIIW